MNRVTLQATTFVNEPQSHKNYGYRIYDDHDQAYDNTFESPITDDLELLAKAMESSNDTVAETLNFVAKNETGLCINDNWYEWDDIKHLWDEVENA